MYIELPLSQDKWDIFGFLLQMLSTCLLVDIKPQIKRFHTVAQHEGTLHYAKVHSIDIKDIIDINLYI